VLSQEDAPHYVIMQVVCTNFIDIKAINFREVMITSCRSSVYFETQCMSLTLKVSVDYKTSFRALFGLFRHRCWGSHPWLNFIRRQDHPLTEYTCQLLCSCDLHLTPWPWYTNSHKNSGDVPRVVHGLGRPTGWVGLDRDFF